MVFKPFFKFSEQQVHIAYSEILFFGTLKGESQLSAALDIWLWLKCPNFFCLLWEPQNITIIVMWQRGVMLDGIHNFYHLFSLCFSWWLLLVIKWGRFVTVNWQLCRSAAGPEKVWFSATLHHHNNIQFLSQSLIYCCLYDKSVRHKKSNKS